MTATLPLLSHAPADAPFAWRRGQPVTRARFLADVDRLAAALPARGHVLNVCSDRYRFAVGLAAALVREQVSLLPPSTHAASVRQLVARFPDTYCLAESVQADIDLPQTLYDDAFTESATTGSAAMPQIPVDRTVACVFTSGSTGVPTMHRKRWGSLVINVRAEADRLIGDSGASSPIAIVATVPPQHMYGFESSLLMAWQGGAALVAERPFYPADIVASLAAIPGRRMLVTTPFHLRTLLDEADALPAVDRIVCATAPLSQQLAATAERRFGAPVYEVYGCTETGQLATRRTTDDLRWHLLGSIALAVDAHGQATASGGHIEQPTILSDVLEAAPDAASRRFHLVGRSADLVNIAGKRTSLGHLTVQLNAIDGVVDGVFLMPEDDRATQDGVTRLVALVVAPTLDAARLLAALRERIDPVFLPRPIHFVDALPRNATGKLTQATLQQLLVSVRPNDRRDDHGASLR